MSDVNRIYPQLSYININKDTIKHYCRLTSTRLSLFVLMAVIVINEVFLIC
jgi:hypothetical protein